MKKRYIVLGLTALIIFIVFRFFLPLVLPFVLAYFFAKSVSPVIHFLTEKLKWKKKVSSLMVVIFVVVAVLAAVGYVLSVGIGQLMLLLQKLPFYQQYVSGWLEEVCCHCDRILDLDMGSSYRYVEHQTTQLYQNIGSTVLPKLSSYATAVFGFLAEAFGGFFIFFLATILILMDDSFPAVHEKIRPLATQLKAAGLAYIKAQGIIVIITATVITLGLFFMGNEYALIFGICIAILDAFPVMGSGVILVPWGLLKIFSGNFYDAAILITLFVITTFLREILEPRLFGKEIGMKPLYVILFVYVGIKLFGIGGVILGPVALTILTCVDNQMKKAGTD